MKKICLLSLFLFLSIFGIAQEGSGTIYFENENILKFKKIKDFQNNPDIANSVSHHKDLAVIFNGTVRSLKFNQISEFKILEFQLNKTIDGLFYVLAEVKTKTNITVKTKYKTVLFLDVEILDELTGEIIEQRVNFAINSKLNIRKIVFD